MTLRVAVDATALPDRRAGAGNYVIELLRAVPVDDVELHLFVKQTHAEEVAELLPKATIHPVSIGSRPARIGFTHLALPRRVRALRADVFFGPHYEVPSGLSCPSVVTFHDPTFFTHPELHERKKVVYFKRAARAGIRRAAHVIAPSRFAKQGAVDHAGADETCTHVIHHGVDLDAYAPADRHDAERRYVLFVGTLEPRKDVPTLIAAFERLDTEHELVLVGQRGWKTEAIDAAIAGAGSRLRWLGYVDERDKIALYQGAAAFVYPSIAEGFGLPVLEAMACGVPVVTTTGSASEEIAADAALLVPPKDTGALRDAIARALTDRSLAAALRKKGRERAESYTWPAAADATVGVWRRAASTSP